MHRKQVAILEARLGEQLAGLVANRGGVPFHAPALAEERWVPRLTACLTACERFFDDRVRLGSEEMAPNRELAEAQWDRVLAAARVLEAFGPFLNEP